MKCLEHLVMRPRTTFFKNLTEIHVWYDKSNSYPKNRVSILDITSLSACSHAN